MGPVSAGPSQESGRQAIQLGNRVYVFVGRAEEKPRALVKAVLKAHPIGRHAMVLHSRLHQSPIAICSWKTLKGTKPVRKR